MGEIYEPENPHYAWLAQSGKKNEEADLETLCMTHGEAKGLIKDWASWKGENGRWFSVTRMKCTPDPKDN